MTGLLKGIGSRRCFFFFFFSAGAVYAWFATCCRRDGLHVGRLTVQTTLYLKVSDISEAQKLQASSSSRQSSLNYVCVCVYIYIHTHTHIYIYMYTCVYTRAHTYACITRLKPRPVFYMPPYTSLYIHIYIYLSTYIHTLSVEKARAHREVFLEPYRCR